MLSASPASRSRAALDGISREQSMKIVVIGGSGLIGTKLVIRLRRCGHEVLAASLASGVNIITGDGLSRALAGAHVVVDVSNSPSWEDRAVLDFFETAGRNLLAAGKVAGVGHHVALSIVGTDRLPHNGYFRAKLAQERLIKGSGIPYTILRSTQFFEFIRTLIDSATVDGVVRVSPALFQPISSDEVVAVLADLALEPPLDGTVEVAGPDARPMDEFVRQFLRATGDGRRVLPDARAPYFGAVLDDHSVTPSAGARLGAVRFEDWLSSSPQRTAV
jgi:uncharacterized protein YbjT (DUF2867 family)